jgi:hypothetical protein
MHSVSGHSGGATFVLRIRNPISPHVDRHPVTKRKLGLGYQSETPICQ